MIKYFFDVHIMPLEVLAKLKILLVTSSCYQHDGCISFNKKKLVNLTIVRTECLCDRLQKTPHVCTSSWGLRVRRNSSGSRLSWFSVFQDVFDIGHCALVYTKQMGGMRKTSSKRMSEIGKVWYWLGKSTTLNHNQIDMYVFKDIGRFLHKGVLFFFLSFFTVPCLLSS